MARRNFEVFNVFVTLTAMKKNDAKGLLRMLRVIVSHSFREDMLNLKQKDRASEKICQIILST